MPRLPRIRPVPRCTRRPLSRSLAAGAAFALVCIAHPSAAHEYWLAPSRYQASARQAVELGALAGTGFRGERKPFASPDCVRFVARTAQLLDLRRIARDGEYVWAKFAPSDEGGALLAFESDFTPITLPAATFDEYLKKEGLDAPLAARRQVGGSGPGRERYRRCAKAWIAGSEVSRATVPIGLPLELVPAEAPGAGSRLGVRVLWQGRPLAGALVRVWRAPLANGMPTDAEARDSVDVAWQGRTDAQGAVLVRVDAAGEWLISVVHMVRCPDLGVADWESTWASLTFERTRAGGR
jgi:uncharacterized GH25 family protein